MVTNRLASLTYSSLGPRHSSFGLLTSLLLPAAPAQAIQRKVRLCSYQLTRPLGLFSAARTRDSTTNQILFSTSSPPLTLVRMRSEDP